jgi:hypothetical protein
MAVSHSTRFFDGVGTKPPSQLWQHTSLHDKAKPEHPAPLGHFCNKPGKHRAALCEYAYKADLDQTGEIRHVDVLHSGRSTSPH